MNEVRNNTGRGLRCLGWLMALVIVHCSLLVGSCARMGSPDGGWYDDTPPYVVGSTPQDKGTGVTGKRIAIYFNEYIKLENAQEKVIVSPPQLAMPEIKDGGKRIIVTLKDTLKENTTYTIDFSDAISDNNEGNPMGNYTFSFSTGQEIDTMEVAGYVLDAQNLEPIKGILVGLYDDFSDTVLKTKPMMRISRTDSRGHFVVKGVAAGAYRAYALQDADADFIYNQKSEMVAFNHDTIKPSWKPDTRQDTIWRDSLHIDQILRVPYTHFLPDDVTLLAFAAVQDSRYLIKTERMEPRKFGFYFSYGDSLLPVIRGLNFESDNAFVVEPSLKNDTVFYWLRDTTLINQDTLRMEVQFMITDSTNMLVNYTDTLELMPKVSYEKRMKDKQKEIEKWEKDQERKKKRGEPYDSIMPPEFLTLKVEPGSIAPDQKVIIESPTPLARLDTAGIHLYTKVDSLWYDAEFVFQPVEGSIRSYQITADWKPAAEYSLEIDSAAIEDIYGLTIKALTQGIKVKSEEDFSTLQVNLSGIKDTSVIVQLINGSDAVVKEMRAKDNSVKFLYVTPGKYYLRAFVDSNGNGVWDTGDYDTGRQPENVYYYPDETECKAKWDVTRNWNLTARPRFQQKPQAITKQKPEQAKKLQNRNLQRAKDLGKEYVRKTTGLNM